MPRRRRKNLEVKPSMEICLNTLGETKSFPFSLPQTVEDCAREIKLLEGGIKAIMERRQVLTAQLQYVLGKQATSSSNQKLEQGVNVVNQEDGQLKGNSAEKGDLPSETASDSWEEKEKFGNQNTFLSTNSFYQYAADEGAEVTSPLISAITKLQRRHDQKMGIKMWTRNLANLFAVADKDDSGHIDEQEYHRMLEMLSISEELKFALRDKFSVIDKDGTNGIKVTEFLEFFLNFPMFKEELTKNVQSNAPYIYEANLSRIQYLRQWLYSVVECPGYNFVSKVLFCIDLILTFIPIVILCMEGAQSSLIVDWPRHRFMWFVSIFFALEYTCGLMMCRYKRRFLFDIVHTFELVSFLFWICYNTFASSNTLDPMGFVVFRIIRFLNLYKVFKLVALEEDLHIYVKTLKLAYTSSGAVLMLLVFSIFLFSLLMYVFERGIYNKNDKSWQRLEEEGESPFADMSACIYFVLVTMTTLGYGDMSPKSHVGRMVAIVTVIVGLCNITFLINIVGDCFEEVFRKFVLKKSKEMERERSVYLNECVQMAQIGSSGWMHLGITSSKHLRHLKVIATANAKELN